MKQRIIISGIGGQGVLFATKVIAEAALDAGLDVLTAETHGMAQRGGTVVSHVKVGPFRSPLIDAGTADTGLFLHAGNVEIHRGLLRPEGRFFVNASGCEEHPHIDATDIARRVGSPVVANLVLIGFAVAAGGLFVSPLELEAVVRRITALRHLDLNLAALRAGAVAVQNVDDRPRP